MYGQIRDDELRLNFFFYRFPSDSTRKEIWSRIIRKQRKEPYFKPHKNTRVCSAHFCDNDIEISKAGLRRLKGSAIPRFEIKVLASRIPIYLYI